jgi:hypothetical protein
MAYLNPGRLGLVGAPTYPMLRDATQSTLFEILNSNRIPYEYNKADNVLVMKETRSRMLFRAVEEFERLRGTNLAWFGLDELTYTQEEAWLRLEGRLRDPKAPRLCGFAVWTPKGFDWVYRRFIAEKVDGYDTILAKPYENRFLLDQIPDFYRRLKKSYDERFYEQEAEGKYLHLHAGLVYTSFDRTEHVSDLVDLDPALPVRWAMDFNYDPMCSLVLQVQNGIIYVLDEIVLRRSGTLAACEAFYGRYGKHKAPIYVYGDASGNQSQTAGSTDYAIIKEYLRNHPGNFELRAMKKNPPVKDRVNLMNLKLRSAAKQVQMYISPRCKELVKDFEQVSFKEGTQNIDKDRDAMRTHLTDALGYFLWKHYKERATAKGDKQLVST